ncbi:hypothetical protein DIPPA_11613 [Diplonema papillatum]|nr:hypothetical protein DIPPA_11613 [Diplonema papillatum]
MGIFNLLSDEHAASDKKLFSGGPGDKVTKHIKAIEEKVGMKKIELWAVVDQKAVKKAKDPTTLALGEKALDGGKSFKDQGIEVGDYMYVKKKGWSPPKVKVCTRIVFLKAC